MRFPIRACGLQYRCDPQARMGKRIDNLRLHGKPLEAGRSYKVAGWAPVAEEARNAGTKPIWELVEPWLKAKGTVSARRPNLPALVGMQGNPGAA